MQHVLVNSLIVFFSLLLCVLLNVNSHFAAYNNGDEIKTKLVIVVFFFLKI